MDELRRLIHDAFAGGRLPTRPVTGHRCQECDEVDAILGGRAWEDVAADFPAYCHDAYPLLTAAAQAYYLPAYMIAALTSSSGIQGVSVASALGESGLRPDQFTPVQRAAVLQWAAAYWRMVEGTEPPAELVGRWQTTAK